MIRYVIKRLLLMIPVLLAVTVMIFTLMYFTKGDAAVIILGGNATQEQLEQKRIELGLKDGYFVRLGRYMWNLYRHGDMGQSYISGRSVSEQIAQRFPTTLRIAFMSVGLAVLLGIPLGIVAAVNQFSWKDNLCMVISLTGASMPGFWIALMMSLLFALKLGWLPPTGIETWKGYIMPVIASSIGGIATIARQTRSSMLEVIRADYIATARAKGQTEHKVIYRHALRNALIPTITSAGGAFGFSLGGSLVAETVFSIPGLGTFMQSNISNRDYPCVMGGVIFLAIVFGLVMLVVDIIYAFVDPRIKSQYSGSKKIKIKEEKEGA